MATTENWRREKAAATKRLPRGLGFLDLKRAYVNPPRFLLFLIADPIGTMTIDLVSIKMPPDTAIEHPPQFFDFEENSERLFLDCIELLHFFAVQAFERLSSEFQNFKT